MSITIGASGLEMRNNSGLLLQMIVNSQKTILSSQMNSIPVKYIPEKYKMIKKLIALTAASIAITTAFIFSTSVNASLLMPAAINAEYMTSPAASVTPEPILLFGFSLIVIVAAAKMRARI